MSNDLAPYRVGTNELPQGSLHALLLAIAWLGELTVSQMQVLVFPERSEKTTRRTLTKAAQAEPPLVQKRSRRGSDTETKQPVPLCDVWSLTPEAHALLRLDEQYPFKTRSEQYPVKAPNPRAERVLEHDLLATELMTQIIGRARRVGISGVAVTREFRLHRERPAPIMDALLMLQMSGMYCNDHDLPWSKDYSLQHETCWRFGVEADMGTEPLSVIQGKARAYRDVFADAAWRADWETRLGTIPTPIWIAPTEWRCSTINGCWHAEWPDGNWLLTTPQWLRKNLFIAHTGRDQHMEVALFTELLKPSVYATFVRELPPPRVPAPRSRSRATPIARPAAPSSPTSAAPSLSVPPTPRAPSSPPAAPTNAASSSILYASTSPKAVRLTPPASAAFTRGGAVVSSSLGSSTTAGTGATHAVPNPSRSSPVRRAHTASLVGVDVNEPQVWPTSMPPRVIITPPPPGTAQQTVVFHRVRRVRHRRRHQMELMVWAALLLIAFVVTA